MQPLTPGMRLDLGAGSLLEVLAASNEGTAAVISMGRARLLVLLGLAYTSLGPEAPPGLSAVLADSESNVDDDIAAWLVGTPDGGSSPRKLSTGRDGWLAVETDGLYLWAESGD